MGWLLLAARVALSFVFALAGLAKLRDLEGSRKAVRDFGLPSGFAKPIGIGLPLVEITVACLLLSIGSALIGAAGALILLLAFIAAIAINMGLGRRPKCHCFGQVHSETIGWTTLARNGVLALLASLLLLQARTNPGPSIVLVARGLTAGQVIRGTLGLLLASAIASLFWLVLHLFRQNGRLLLRIEALEANRSATVAHPKIPARPVPQGLPIGSQAIPFDLPKIGGGSASLADFLKDGKPLLLISTDPKCGPCNALMPDIVSWQKMLADELTVVLVSHGSRADNRAKVVELGLINVMVEKDHKIAEMYQALGTPTGVLIRADGTIGSPAIGGADGIRQLVTNKAWTGGGLAVVMRSFAQPPQPVPPKTVLPVGSPAPPFALPDLDGNTIESASLNGNGTVLVLESRMWFLPANASGVNGVGGVKKRKRATTDARQHWCT